MLDLGSDMNIFKNKIMGIHGASEARILTDSATSSELLKEVPDRWAGTYGSESRWSEDRNPSDFRGQDRPWQEPTMPMGSSFNFSISSSTR